MFHRAAHAAAYARGPLLKLSAGEDCCGTRVNTGSVADLHGRPLCPLRGLVARVEALGGVGQPHAQPPLNVLQSLGTESRKVVG